LHPRRSVPGFGLDKRWQAWLNLEVAPQNLTEKLLLPRRKFIGLIGGGFLPRRHWIDAARAVLALSANPLGRLGGFDAVEPEGAADASPLAPTDWAALEWKKGAPSPFARAESPSAVVGGKLFLFGGFTDDLQASNQIDVYDPANDSWTRKKEMPARLTHLNAVIDGGTIWFAGGFKGKHPGPVTNEVWKYDIASDAWTPGPPLPEPRGGGGLALVEQKLHYFGGYKADRDTNAGDHWSLPLAGGAAWQRESDLPEPRGHVSATTLEGRIYALGGAHGHDKTQIDLNSCHRFDPALKKWVKIASLPDGRSHFESSTIIRPGRIVSSTTFRAGRILIVGGRCNNSQPPRNVVDDLLEYDSGADVWRAIGTMPRKVLAPAAAIISGHIVVTSGGLDNPRPLTAATWVAALPAGE
jgi:hypothetical protein